jgi:glucose/arabinose dehydrogenase
VRRSNRKSNRLLNNLSWWPERLEQRTLLASISNAAPYNGQQQVAVGSTINLTFGEAMNAATLTTENVILRDNNGALVSSTLSYNSTSRVLTIDPVANLVSNAGYYTVRVVGGTAGVRAGDNSTLSADYYLSFTCGSPGFTQQTVFSGLDQPVNIEFAADGRIYIAERSGIIKLYDSLTDTTPATVADFRTNVHNFWDRGLLGMALDPQFNSGRPFIYILYTYDGLIGQAAPRYGTAGGTTDSGGPDPTGAGSLVSGRLSRFAVGSNGLITGGETVLIHDWVNQFPSHSIGDLKFGPDGFLYASSGDGASFSFTDFGQNGNPFNDPFNEGGALRSLDVLTDGDPAGLNGTVIRINPDTGAAAPNNPFASSTDANKRRVIAYGLRNPFRITFRPGTDELWIGDVGWGTWEEINRIRDVNDTVAENFGWPAYEGTGRQSGYDGLNNPLIESLYSQPNAHSTPFYEYSHSQQIVPGSDEPTGGSSPSGVAFYQNGSYPLAYEGALFFADYSRDRIYVMYRGPNGELNPASRQIFSRGKAVELTTGPGGELYWVDMLGGRIARFTASGYNRQPTARITTDKTTGPLPLTVRFDGQTSSDPDPNATLAFAWDLDGDGQFDDSTLVNPQWTYTVAADVTVRLRVTDNAGATDTTSIVIYAGNTAPVPTINLPATGTRWNVGNIINFSGSATDTQDGTLAASRLAWDVVLIHGNEINPANTHEHRITSFNGVAGGTFTTIDHGYPSWIELRLTATDSRGLTATTSRRLDPNTTQMSFASNPAGLQMSFNGSTFTAPFTRTVITGSANSVSAISPQTVGTTTYAFDQWSNGGGQTQNIIAPVGSASYTASFDVAQVVKLTGTVIGTPGSWNNDPNVTKDKAFDGNLATYFDAPNPNGSWVGLDLGQSFSITQIRFGPRPTLASRMIGGVFQASNTADFSSGVVDLHTIVAAPADNQFTSVAVSSGAAFRYVRYLSPNEGYGNISELEFYTSQAVRPPNAPTNLTSTSGNDGIRLAWTDTSSNELNFVVERRVNGSTTWSEIASLPAGTTSMTDAAVVAGTSYDYRVKASNAAGSSAYTNVSTITAPTITLPTPLIDLAFNEGQVSTVGNAGSIGGNLTKTNPPAWSTNTPRGAGFSVDYGTTTGNYVVESAAALPGLAGLSRFTITGWLNNRSSAEGSGGNRVVSWARVEGGANASDGVDLVYRSDGSLMLGIDAWVDNSTARSSPGMVTTSNGAINSNWRFFAVTYDSTLASGQVSWYFGSAATPAALDQTDSYNAGTVNNNVGKLAIGHFNDGTRSTGLDRMFRGLIDGVRVYGSTLSAAQVIAVQNATGGVAPTVPIAPTSLTATAVNSTQINLSWVDASNNESQFIIERRLGTTGTFAQVGVVDTGVTSYTDSSVVAATTYNYRVYAMNAVGNSGYSNTAAATTPGGTTTPAAPTGLAATVLAGPQVRLNWTDNATNETGFQIQRRYAGWIWEDLAAPAANSATFTDTTSIGGVVYEYRVRAVNGSNTSAWSNATLVDTNNIGAQPPAAPSSLTGVATSGTNVNLAWQDNSADETGFIVQRRTPGGSWAGLATNPANDTTFSDSTAIAGGTYEYRVLATNGSLDSTPSNVVTVTTPGGVGVPATPTHFSAWTLGNGTVEMSWRDVSTNETAFRIERRYRGWIWETLTNVAANATSHVDTTVFGGVAYEYRVLAIGPGGGSAPAAGVEVDMDGPLSATGLAATPASATRINLAWTDRAANETGYRVERRRGTAGAWAEIATLAAGSTSYADTGVVAGTLYAYRVVSLAASSLNFSNIATATTP